MHYVEARGILSPRNGMNIYRGCTHGCIYCDSRSACYQMTHEFEDIEVKINAPALLEDALSRKRKPCMIGTGSMCDPYLPLEEELGLTRKCLEIIHRHGFGATVLTKSARVLRDLDLLIAINAKSKCVVQMTMTTADNELCKIIEPNVSTTAERYEALKVLQANGIPTVVWLTPFLPFINDTEENLRQVLALCFEAGVMGFICYAIGLTLRNGNRQYFYKKLDEHFPGLKERYQSKYGDSYYVTSPNNEKLMAMLHSECDTRGIMSDPKAVFAYLREFPEPSVQLKFF